MTDALFQNKKKNIFVGVMAASYLIVTLLSADFSLYNMSAAASWRYNLNVLFIWIFSHTAPICVLIYLLTRKKEFRVRKWIIPIGYGLSCLYALLVFPGAVSVVSGYTTVYTVIVFAFTCLSELSVLLCFVGTLFDFEFLKLYQAGILLNVLVRVAVLITDTVFAVTDGYFTTYGISGLSFTALSEFLILVLFDIGLFLLTTNKE